MCSYAHFLTVTVASNFRMIDLYTRETCVSGGQALRVSVYQVSSEDQQPTKLIAKSRNYEATSANYAKPNVMVHQPVALRTGTSPFKLVFRILKAMKMVLLF